MFLAPYLEMGQKRDMNKYVLLADLGSMHMDLMFAKMNSADLPKQ